MYPPPEGGLHPAKGILCYWLKSLVEVQERANIYKYLMRMINASSTDSSHHGALKVFNGVVSEDIQLPVFCDVWQQWSNVENFGLISLELGETIILCDALPDWGDACRYWPPRKNDECEMSEGAWHMALGIKCSANPNTGLNFLGNVIVFAVAVLSLSVTGCSKKVEDCIHTWLGKHMSHFMKRL